MSVRVEDTVEDMSEDDEGSEVMEGSVVSSVTDKYGFMAGDNSMEKSKVDLEIVRRREIKWVEMMASWDTYMMRSVPFLTHRYLYSKRSHDTSNRW